LNLLSANSLAVEEYGRVNKIKPDIFLRQSFMTAAKLFRSIDAPIRSIIVPYDKEGKELIGQLCAAFEVEKQFALIKKAQQYSVNLFPYEFEALAKRKALNRVQEETEIFYLDYPYYSRKTGLSLEPVNQEEQFEYEYIDA